MQAATARTRIQFKNILFATDFSHASAMALPFAVEIAKRSGAKLFAVHAKTPETYALPPSEIWPAVNAELERETDQLKETLSNKAPDVPNEVIITEGGIWAVVETVAVEKNCDLIVVGTSGRRGIGKFILGSVAEEILRRANCPVLTIGPHSSLDAPRETRFKKIVYATDFGPGSHKAADYAVALAEEHQAHLTLLHVINHAANEGVLPPQEMEAAVLDRLRLLVPPDAQPWCEPHAIVRHGEPSAEILEIAEAEETDLIVLGVRNFKGRVRATHFPVAVAHQVISHATCPVLTVRN